MNRSIDVLRARCDVLRAGCAIACVLGGCALPDFETARPGELLSSGPACGLSSELDESCDACIRSQCCELSEACAEGTACGEDLLEPITPIADYSTDFDELLGCMQNHCATECKVHWGCVDQYTWPEIEGPIDQGIGVVDFVSNDPVEGASVMVCDASDPTPNCRSGKVAMAVTDDAGEVRLRGLSQDLDNLYRFEAPDFLSATARFSEPMQRLAGFTQFEVRALDLAAFALATGVHTTLDEPFPANVGHIIVRVQSCLPLRYLETDLRATGPDVRIEYDEIEGASRFFYSEPTGEVSATRTDTSVFGYGGAFNFPQRNIELRAIDTLSGSEVASGRVQTVPGGMGFLYLLPRSRK
jgi:hypothetical protein